jgi:DNA invertase Pin-like site-specific DNA recombinase
MMALGSLRQEGTMIVGYARTSTVEQEAGFEAQIRQLKSAGVERIFSEQVSAVASQRPQLALALDFVREGDCFAVTKLDRLARSVPDLCDIAARLEAKGVQLKVLDLNLDTSTPTGRLMFNIFGSVAQFERELIRERMLVGVAKARAEGKYKGRAPTARAKTPEVKRLHLEGISKVEIARRLGISRASVYRSLEA